MKDTLQQQKLSSHARLDVSLVVREGSRSLAFRRMLDVAF